eukprot:symbB.v1.2.014200.t1/scaffold1027.1/size171366/2
MKLSKLCTHLSDFSIHLFDMAGHHRYSLSIRIQDLSVNACMFGTATVSCNMCFQAGANHRTLGPQSRDRLLLMLGTHQGTIGIIMLQKRYHAYCYRHRCST